MDDNNNKIIIRHSLLDNQHQKRHAPVIFPQDKRVSKMQYSNQKRQYLGSVTQIEHQTPQLQPLNKKLETILNRTPWLTSGLNHLLAQMTPCGAVNFFAERVSCKKNSKTRKLQQFTLLLTYSTDYAGPGCINSKAKARQITMDD